MKLTELTAVFIELTTACNLRCPFCPGPAAGRPAAVMPRALFEGILEQVRELGLRPHLYYHLLGEPLLHPEHRALFALARQRGFAATLFTNGIQLGRAAVSMADDFEEIAISLLEPGTIGGHTVSADAWDRHWSGIRNFVLGNAAAPGSCRIRFRVLAEAPGRWRKRRDHRAFQERVELLCRELDWPAAPVPADWSFGREFPLGPKTVIEPAQLVPWELNPKRYQSRYGFCTAWRRGNHGVAVMADGRVVLCCLDYAGATAVGSLHERSLAELLRGNEFQTWKDGFSRGRLLHPACRSCRGADRLVPFILRSLNGLRHHVRWQR